MFRAQLEIVDSKVAAWARRARDVSGDWERIDAARPGFTLAELLAEIDLPGEPHFGRVTRELSRLVYWVFAGGGGPAAHLGSKPGKPVLLADTYHSPPNGSGRAYLSVSAGNHQSVLIPCPHVPPQLLFAGAFETVSDARLALHEVVHELVERANIAWPLALAVDPVP